MAGSVVVRPGPGAFEGLRISLRRRRQLKDVQYKQRYLPVRRGDPFGEWAERRVRVARYTKDDANDPVAITVSGVYSVYCGMGWEHAVQIEQRHQVWPGDDLWDLALRAWKDRAPDAAAEVAAELVDRQLEDWFDPCDTGDEDD